MRVNNSAIVILMGLGLGLELRLGLLTLNRENLYRASRLRIPLQFASFQH